MSDPAPPPHPPTKSEIESALVVEIRAQMADPNITPEWYESLKGLLAQFTKDPEKFPGEC
jgi:hypothetical protein